MAVVPERRIVVDKRLTWPRIGWCDVMYFCESLGDPSGVLGRSSRQTVRSVRKPVTAIQQCALRARVKRISCHDMWESMRDLGD